MELQKRGGEGVLAENRRDDSSEERMARSTSATKPRRERARGVVRAVI